MMKEYFIDKGIPIIITEIGVITEQKKDKASIREYLYTFLSLSMEIGGILPCLWDTSKKGIGNMNYYDRENNVQYDEKLREIFFFFSKGNNEVKLKDLYYETNKETTNTLNKDRLLGYSYYLPLNNRKPLKIILNGFYKGVLII